jgi:cytochrome c-type biogenesis protein CcmH/NrfG
VLERLPASVWKRLKAIHFNDRSRGGRCYGYVRRGLDEIALCALPPRVSPAGCLRRNQSPGTFGAIRGCQWPRLAVRRFMLYDVFLHELGHLQVVDIRAKSTRRRFAGETVAQDFADEWRRALWSRPFDHPDPVHNPPSDDERQSVRDHWAAANVDFKKGLTCKQSAQYAEAISFLSRAVDRYPGHALALELLGGLTYAGWGTAQSSSSAIRILDQAVHLDPTLFQATMCLGFALARENREAEARRYPERAIGLDPWPARAAAMYADVVADWGYFAEAEQRFQKVLSSHPRCALAVRDFGRCLIRDGHPDADTNLERAIALFERAVALDPGAAESHYHLGSALACVDGAENRAINHLKRSLKINPGHEKAAARLAEIKAERAERPTG